MPLVKLQGIAKSYGGVHALRHLDLDIHAGEVLAICGENGAGKSTLNKILSGSVQPDSGSVFVNGRPMPLGSVLDAESNGIAIVHQESSAFLELTAAENCQMMHEPGTWWLDRRELTQRTKEALASAGESFDPDTSADQLSLAQRQMVAIARAICRDCQVLILDEPTSSLSAKEANALFGVIGKLKRKGVAIVYVSHRLEEIFQLADRVAILRDGELIAVKPVQETNSDDLIQLMVGRPIASTHRLARTPGEPALEVQCLSGFGYSNVSFAIGAGEVVALSGLVGAGRSEIAKAIFGIEPATSGEVKVGGVKLGQGNEAAMAAQIALVPEDRQQEGLHLALTVQENLSMAASPALPQMLNRQLESRRSQQLVQGLGIKTASDFALASSLSGGNQQKVLLGKWLANPPKVLILDEPTRGVDVGAKDQIHSLIDELAASGVAILVISSEMNEVLALADRVLVIRQGRLVGELAKSEATQAKLLELALPQESDESLEKIKSKAPRREVGVGLLLLATIFAASLFNPTFLAFENLRDILVKIAPPLIVGAMMTLVILAREIDISVGSLMGLCAATLGIASSSDRLGLPPIAGAGLCLGVGAIGGLLNGMLVAYARIPSIIVTLGTLALFKGMTEIALGGKWIERIPSELRFLGTGSAIGIPLVVWVAILMSLAGIWITRRTRFGLRIMAIGSNPHAASLNGISITKTRLALFALTGISAGLAALFSATQLQVIESGFGSGFELVVVASVIVGGTSIRGGRGSIVGTILGTTLLGIVATVLIFLRLGDAATYWERAVQGCFILAAVLADSLTRRKR